MSHLPFSSKMFVQHFLLAHSFFPHLISLTISEPCFQSFPPRDSWKLSPITGVIMLFHSVFHHHHHHHQRSAHPLQPLHLAQYNPCPMPSPHQVSFCSGSPRRLSPQGCLFVPPVLCNHRQASINQHLQICILISSPNFGFLTCLILLSSSTSSLNTSLLGRRERFLIFYFR